MVLRSEILVNKNVMPTAEQALPGRDTPMSLPEFHYVFKDTPLLGPFFEGAIDFAIAKDYPARGEYVGAV